MRRIFNEIQKLLERPRHPTTPHPLKKKKGMGNPFFKSKITQRKFGNIFESDKIKSLQWNITSSGTLLSNNRRSEILLGVNVYITIIFF